MVITRHYDYPCHWFSTSAPCSHVELHRQHYRMQIILPNKQDAGSVMVSTDRTQFTAEWFLRENGYVLNQAVVYLA